MGGREVSISDTDLEAAIVKVYGESFANSDIPLDRILCDPEERGHFITKVQAELSQLDEYTILNKAISLRKRSGLPLLASVRRSQEERNATPNFIDLEDDAI
jgi:hypothetical protein